MHEEERDLRDSLLSSYRNTRQSQSEITSVKTHNQTKLTISRSQIDPPKVERKDLQWENSRNVILQERPSQIEEADSCHQNYEQSQIVGDFSNSSNVITLSRNNKKKKIRKKQKKKYEQIIFKPIKSEKKLQKQLNYRVFNLQKNVRIYLYYTNFLLNIVFRIFFFFILSLLIMQGKKIYMIIFASLESFALFFYIIAMVKMLVFRSDHQSVYFQRLSTEKDWSELYMDKIYGRNFTVSKVVKKLLIFFNPFTKFQSDTKISFLRQDIFKRIQFVIVQIPFFLTYFINLDHFQFKNYPGSQILISAIISFEVVRYVSHYLIIYVYS